MKKLLSAVIAAVMLTSLCSDVIPASAKEVQNTKSVYADINKPKYVGDIDFDETITSIDSLMVLCACVMLDDFDEIQKKLADVDNDGSITSADSLAILRYSVGLTENNYIGTNILDSTNSITAARGNSCSIFKKVVCCGDSYTSGHIVDDNGKSHPTNEEYAWPHYMSDFTGNNWYNCGSSGTNVITWQTAKRGLAKAKSLGKTQAYIIGLGINDISNSERHIELGTPNDIGTNAQTYYGGMSAIIRKLNAISPQAKIFVNTCPRTGGTAKGRYADYNQAVRDIVEAYKDTYPVHCIDLEANIDMYTVPILDMNNPKSDYRGGHYTAVGYKLFAENYEIILSNYINEHIEEFLDVSTIEYD